MCSLHNIVNQLYFKKKKKEEEEVSNVRKDTARGDALFEGIAGSQGNQLPKATVRETQFPNDFKVMFLMQTWHGCW